MLTKFLIAMALGSSLFLTGCNDVNPKILTKEIFVAVVPPDILFNCPQIMKTDFPNLNTATNQEISDFITLLYSYNKQCGISQKKIKAWIAAAEKLVAERNQS